MRIEKHSYSKKTFRNLLNPGDIRSRNNYPKTVQKSPGSNIQAIDEVDEEETTQMQMSKLMVTD